MPTGHHLSPQKRRGCRHISWQPHRISSAGVASWCCQDHCARPDSLCCFGTHTCPQNQIFLAVAAATSSIMGELTCTIVALPQADRCTAHKWQRDVSAACATDSAAAIQSCGNSKAGFHTEARVRQHAELVLRLEICAGRENETECQNLILQMAGRQRRWPKHNNLSMQHVRYWPTTPLCRHK